uniref:Acetylserotonin O-methyltransferase n=1 Tax=Gouania willdenowi TaxID=441366 RepID=A0A8C5I0Y1_GOUWI
QHLETVFTSCELGVFDVLEAAERPLTAEEVSRAVGASVDGAERLTSSYPLPPLPLPAHVSVCYSNTQQASAFLTRSSPTSLYQAVQFSSGTNYLCWITLCVDGGLCLNIMLVLPSETTFSQSFLSDEEMGKFMQLMNAIWNICGKDVITAFDLSPFKNICDLGGCSGALAKQCTSSYPECNVIIFDLSKVVQMSRKHFVTEADQRISFQEGDFFKDSLPEADLYILSRILHDWTDQRCIELLRRIHKACRSGGAVLVVEALLNQDGSGPLTAQLYSLNMLVQTEGRERTDAQYAALLAAAGFSSIQHRRTGKIYDAVLGYKQE